MGRAVYTYIKDPEGNIVWSSTELEGVKCEHGDTCFFGRNDETTIIALYADNETGEINITNAETFNHIRDELQAKQDENDKIYNRLMDRIDALRECRAKASSIAIFTDFDDALNDSYESLDDTYWNRGGDMVQLMNRTREQAKELATAKQGFFIQGDFAGYTIYWRNDE